MEIKIHVVPKARNFEVLVEGDLIKIKVPEEPKKGKINQLIVKLFKEKGINCKIIRGLKSRKKLLLCDKSFEEVKKALV